MQLSSKLRVITSDKTLKRKKFEKAALFRIPYGNENQRINLNLPTAQDSRSQINTNAVKNTNNLKNGTKY